MVRAQIQDIRTIQMAEHVVPHFHNDIGVAVIEIGAKEFMCIGATPPFDHPHVFCDMGDDNEFICSYCSTLYRYNPSDRKSTRLNSSHGYISYAVFCLKKKKKHIN